MIDLRLDDQYKDYLKNMPLFLIRRKKLPFCRND